MVDHLGRALCTWVVTMDGWTALLLAGAIAIDRAVARHTRASLRIALYAPIALRILWPVSWSLPVARASHLSLLLPLRVLSSSHRLVGGTPAGHFAGMSWQAAVVSLYVAVVIGMGVRALAARLTLSRRLSSARPLAMPSAPCPVVCHEELGPMVAGLLAPRIVLPQTIVRGDPGVLVCVARHEIAHVRRRDPWLAAAIELLVIVAWPVLPLWVAAWRVRHLMELACDEAALTGAGIDERRRYGHVLLDVAERYPAGLAAAASLHFGSALRARVEAIARHRPWPRWVQSTLVATAIAGLGACSAAAPGAAPQEASGSSAPNARAATSVDRYGYEFAADADQRVPGGGPDSPSNSAAKRSDTWTWDSSGGARLPPEVIQAVVHKRFSAMGACYESAQRSDPHLEGTVRISFVIAPSGRVESAKDDGSSLGDPGAVECVRQEFSKLSFPPPQDGYVTVVYPVLFTP